MSDNYTPSDAEVIANYSERGGGASGEIRRWLTEHDAKVRAEERERYNPAKDERLARYMALVTPLGYASALEVVNALTAMMTVEARVNEIAEQARREEREKAAQIAESEQLEPHSSYALWRNIATRIRNQEAGE